MVVKSRFVIVPMPVMQFVMKARPANAGRAYLYLYSMSIAVGKKVTPWISYRDLADYFGVKYGTIELSMRLLQRLNAIVPIARKNKKGYGQKYIVNVPEYVNGEFIFVDLEESSIFDDLVLDENSKTFVSVIKRFKSRKEKAMKDQLKLFDDWIILSTRKPAKQLLGFFCFYKVVCVDIFICKIKYKKYYHIYLFNNILYHPKNIV